MSEWKEYKLGDVVNFKRGYDLPSTKRASGKYPIVSSSGITDYHDKFKVEAPGVVTGRYGTIGKVFFVEEPFWPLNTTLYVTDFKHNDPKFIFYFLHDIDFDKYNDKSTVPGINRNHLHLEQVIIPLLSEQKSIASILSSLDDKIDLLHRQNATLEAMAETLFRQWFVEEMEENTESFMQLGDLIESVSVTHKFNKSQIIFLNTSDIYFGEVLTHQPVNVKGLPGQAKKTIKNGDILFSEIRPANGRWAFIDFDADNYVVSTKLMVLRSTGKLSSAFIYFYLTNSMIVDWLQMLAESRSGTFPQITFDQLKDLKVKIPSEEILRNGIMWSEQAIQKIKSNNKQIRLLTSLRDGLLPKLMSGEIRIN